uniref:sperm surface protein Sp17 isoform X5 n=1 Tax=Callithrix jacchus TaxID=9483 RepID=UPI0023DD0AE8|nr:sperm surface protein Sp17 isoform X5 [Callithrix jacchus]
MSIPFSNTHCRIPQGFGNLLEGLTREILREQPDNIPAFAAAYFQSLLEKREKTNFDPAEWGSKIDDRFYNNHAFEQEPPEKCDPKQEKSQISAKEEETPVTILKQEPPEKCDPKQEKSQISGKEEETPVTILDSSEEDKEKEEVAAVKIQAAFRGHIAREEVKKMKTDSLQNEEDEEKEENK